MEQKLVFDHALCLKFSSCNNPLLIENPKLMKDHIFCQIPDTEGKAGMVAIHDPDDEVDVQRLGIEIKDLLPSFARPLFVRLVKQLDITGNNFHA